MSSARWVPCAFCAQLLDPDALGVYERTTGWVRRRDQGGGNAVALPTRHAQFAHASCIDNAAAGRQGQRALFGTGGT